MHTYIVRDRLCNVYAQSSASSAFWRLSTKKSPVTSFIRSRCSVNLSFPVQVLWGFHENCCERRKPRKLRRLTSWSYTISYSISHDSYGKSPERINHYACEWFHFVNSSSPRAAKEWIRCLLCLFGQLYFNESWHLHYFIFNAQPPVGEIFDDKFSLTWSFWTRTTLLGTVHLNTKILLHSILMIELDSTKNSTLNYRSYGSHRN